MPPKKKKSDHTDASPQKSLARELQTLRSNLRATIRSYEKKLGSDLAAVEAWNAALADGKQTPTREQLRDIGDMISLLRKLKLKPEKGRRRDLRKIDGVIEELSDLSRQKRSS